LGRERRQSVFQRQIDRQFDRKTGLNDDCVRSLARHCCEDAFQLVIAANHGRLDFKAHHWGGLLNVFQEGLHKRIAGIAQNAYAACRWYDFPDQFEAFGRQFIVGGRQSCDVAAGPCQARDEP